MTENYDKVKKYITKLKEKLKEKQLQWFWVMADRKEFKPIKGKTKAYFREKFAANPGRYKGKHLAEIRLYINADHIEKNEFIFSIKIGIMIINEKGEFDKGPIGIMPQTWGSRVNWFAKDFVGKDSVKITLKLVQRLMKLTQQQILWTDAMSGIPFTDFLDILKEEKIQLFENSNKKKLENKI
jgi:hypothetical protein